MCFVLQVNYVVQEAIVVIKDIFRKYPNKYESIISTLCENLDTLDEPEARYCESPLLPCTPCLGAAALITLAFITHWRNGSEPWNNFSFQGYFGLLNTVHGE